MEKEENLKENPKVSAEKEYRRLEARLQELKKGRESKWGFFLAFFLPFLIVLLLELFVIQKFHYEIDIKTIAMAIITGSLFGCFGIAYYILLYDMRESSIRRRMLDYEVDDVQNEVKEDIFENSIKMSYKYLDQYYLQTREQAQRGFLVTVCVSIFGAMLIGIGIIAMFFDRITPAYITCASGVLTEFIAAIFFYLYNRTIASMSKYHNKLVLSQNISIALKVAESLDGGEKEKAKHNIINELIKDINTHLVKEDSVDERATKEKR